MWAERYFEAALEKLQEVEEVNAAAMQAAAGALADALAGDHLIYAFGAGHSAMLVMDIFYRAGGLVPVQPIFSEKILLDLVPVTETTRWEKTEGWAGGLVGEYGVSRGDALLAISTSGRNAAPIDVALAAKAAGATVIALTSVAYANSLPASHSSGKRLHEVADIVLDNRAEPGDAAIALPGLSPRVAPLSTVVGSALLQAVVAETTATLLDRGIAPPVFLSSNLPGGREHNDALFEKLRGRLRYL